MFHRSTGDDQSIDGALSQGLLPADVQIVQVLLIPAFVGVGVEADPDRFDLKHRQAKRMQQVEFVLLPQRHDVENADAQWPDVLAFGLFGLDPGDPVAFDGTDLVVTAGEDQCHRSPGWIRRGPARSRP